MAHDRPTSDAPGDGDQARPAAVFIVDDHGGYRSVAVAVVEATDGFRLSGTAATAGEAVEAILAADPPPDLVLMDVNLGDGSGVDVAAAVTTTRPHIKVIFVSALSLEELPVEATTSGADGYLPKVQLSPTTLEEMRTGTYDWRP